MSRSSTKGTFLERARVVNELSQEDAARRIGVPQRTWSYWEKNDNVPTKWRGQVALLLGVKTRELKKARLRGGLGQKNIMDVVMAIASSDCKHISLQGLTYLLRVQRQTGCDLTPVFIKELLEAAPMSDR